MIVGAVCGFAGAYLTGSTAGRRAVRHRRRDARSSLLFGILTLGLAVNQVATGLALTILGVGLSGLIGAGFVGAEDRAGAARSTFPCLTDIPLHRPHPVRPGLLRLRLDRAGRRHLVVPLSARAPAWSCAPSATTTPRRTRSAIRCCSIRAAGGAVRRRLRRARRRLPVARLYAVLDRGHDRGRGWIALALVVFASWRPCGWWSAPICSARSPSCSSTPRRSASAFPSQLMSALPYLATVARARRRFPGARHPGSAAPASLGHGFRA